MLTIIEDKPKLVLGAEKWQAAPFRFLDNLQVFEDSGDPGYELPNGYIKLKWVESDGTAYLNTGIYATVNTGARVKYEYTESGSAAILGIYHASPRDDALFISTNSGALDTTNVFAAHGGATIQNGPVALNTEYTTSINFKGDGKIHVGNTVGSIGTTTPYNQYPILLGARYNAGNGNITGSHSKIKIAEFTEGKVFSHRYIPCINPNGVVGYYDVVTQTFSGSSTSTPFIAGPVVLPDGYTQLEYIRGTGTQYINTGIKANSAYTYKFKVRRTSPYNTNIWGVKTNSSYATDSCIILGWTGTNYIGGYSHKGSGSGGNAQVVLWETDYHTIEFNPTGEKFIIDGVNRWDALKCGCLTNENWSSDIYNLYLGGTNTVGSFVGGGVSDWAQYEVWDNDVLIQNLITVKDSSNVVGMYDYITKAFLTNQGTGNFVPGPAIV